MNINYNNITKEDIEKYIEFIDWSLVPYLHITDDLQNKFGSVNDLKLRLWFEKIISNLELRTEENIYPNSVFFFLNEECYMQLSKESGDLWCSYEKLWSIFQTEYKKEYYQIQYFIKNVMEQHFGIGIITPQYVRKRGPSWNELISETEINKPRGAMHLGGLRIKNKDE